MIKKGTKLYSILFGVCPKCQNESMYNEKNPYIITDTLKINDNCFHCKTKYRLEPSFFYGSMYVSYGVGVAFAVASFVITYLIMGTSLMTSFYGIVGTLVVFMPIIMRLSRNIWINLFMNYDPKLDKKSS
ncbi:DUF983 domain-containing protein [Winogradskyella aurantiaca]|uniref:DUF983 domain-containing protein n=1 Tax=Winogradskyella aurantiaca TaxID=2219558 RepID=UPI000E1D2BEE|nr:DUF983 domain-containing protein [Winogradskyella aurantiaca]